MDKNKYVAGNLELLAMVEDRDCSVERMEELIKDIKDINAPILDGGGISSTYLFEAVAYGNAKMVELLLKYGANPNYVNEKLIGDCALWQVQYADEKYFDEYYKIAKLLLANGADPNLIVEEETFYDYVAFKVFIDQDYGDKEYLQELLKLLAFYGGGGVGYPKPEIVEKLNFSRLDEYHFGKAVNSEGKEWCCILNPDGYAAMWF